MLIKNPFLIKKSKNQIDVQGIYFCSDTKLNTAVKIFFSRSVGYLIVQILTCKN